MNKEQLIEKYYQEGKQKLRGKKRWKNPLGEDPFGPISPLSALWALIVALGGFFMFWCIIWILCSDFDLKAFLLGQIGIINVSPK